MSSTPSQRLRFEQQATGENLNTWGPKEVAALNRLEEAIAARSAITVSGPVTLTVSNYTADQARSAFLDLSGSGGTITIPTVEKIYLVRNAASGAVTFTTGSGATAVVAAGDLVSVVTDGTNVYRLSLAGYLALTGGTISGDLTVSGNLHATSDNSLALGGQLPGYYTDIVGRLGFTPANAADSRIVNAVQTTNNLSDLSSLATALGNLGLTGSSGGGSWGGSWAVTVPVKIGAAVVNVIFQGGVVGGVSPDSSSTATFATPFPNACWQVYPSLRLPVFSTTYGVIPGVAGTPSKTGCTLTNKSSGGGSLSADIVYWAVGY